ncbi:MAG: biopolymer transporter ExbD [Deltaproteobacteria bacterium]|nr:biopolymer transporter ExbD [Deltaproteobacteria bacterium]
MGGSASSDDDGMIAGINVTPFVDICLVLLVVFMVTAKYIVSRPTIPVDLPRAATGQAQQENQTMSVTIDRTGQIFVDTRPVNEAQLLQVARERKRANRDVRAIISADQRVPHGRFVLVVDTIRNAEISRFAIQTESPGETAGQ